MTSVREMGACYRVVEAVGGPNDMGVTTASVGFGPASTLQSHTGDLRYRIRLHILIQPCAFPSVSHSAICALALLDGLIARSPARLPSPVEIFKSILARKDGGTKGRGNLEGVR